MRTRSCNCGVAHKIKILYRVVDLGRIGYCRIRGGRNGSNSYGDAIWVAWGVRPGFSQVSRKCDGSAKQVDEIHASKHICKEISKDPVSRVGS